MKTPAPTINIFKAGFTMLELIIVVAIMALMTTFILYSNRDLNSSLLVSNTAYEINLIVREAQAYGLGVQATGNTSDDFKYSQGVHFDTANPTQVIIFSDKNDDKAYTGSGEDAQIYVISSDRAGQILALCKPTGIGNGCNPAGSTLDVMFKRPNPEAIFRKGADLDNGPFVINLGFPKPGMCRSLTLEKSGAIQINQTYCVYP